MWLSSLHIFEENQFYKIKNHTPVKRWGTPQNFILALIDELEKQIIKKTVEVGQ